MKHVFHAMLLMSAATLFAPAVAWAQEWAVEGGGGAHLPKPMRAPLSSDVLFSMRSPRPDGPGVAQEFRANRIEWIYSNDARLVTSLKIDMARVDPLFKQRALQHQKIIYESQLDHQ